MPNPPVHERDRLQRLREADLNDLLVLSLLLNTRGVSKSAEKLGLSQPAVSRTLDRLRQSFGDPLLVRSGNAMVLTPRANHLLPLVEAFLSNATQILAGDAWDEPASFSREVRISCSEYVQFVIAQLLPRIRAEAPRLQVNFVPMLAAEVMSTELAAGNVDLVVGMLADTLTSLHTEHLYDERFVCLVRRRAGAGASPKLSFAEFCATPHLDVSPSGRRILSIRIDSVAQRLGGSRSVVSTISSFLAAPEIVASTGLLCLVPEGIARRLMLPEGVVVAPLDFMAPVLDIVMYWHQVTDQDVVCTWLRSRFVEAFGRPA